MMQHAVTPLPLLPAQIQNSDTPISYNGSDGKKSDFEKTLSQALVENSGTKNSETNSSDQAKQTGLDQEKNTDLLAEDNLPTSTVNHFSTPLSDSATPLVSVQQNPQANPGDIFSTEGTLVRSKDHAVNIFSGQKAVASKASKIPLNDPEKADFTRASEGSDKSVFSEQKDLKGFESRTTGLRSRILPSDIIQKNDTKIDRQDFKFEQSTTLAEKSSNKELAVKLENYTQSSPTSLKQQTSLRATTIFKEGIPAPLSAEASVSDDKTNKLLRSVDSIKLEVSEPKPAQRPLLRGVSILESVSRQTYTPNDTEAITTENIITKLTIAPFETVSPSLLRERTPTPLRQDIEEQYFNAKLKTADVETKVKSESQQFQQSTDSGAQSKLLSTSSQTMSTTTETQQTTTPFSTFLGENSVETLSGSAKGIEAGHSSTTIYEDEVIQQVIRKFQVSKQINDSKLVIKLHPAELGELKIDVQLKNGAISASIVAQNRQVQEILEKNLPKLKELMQQQGLKVDEIAVQFESDVLKDFKQFEEHLAQDSSFNSKPKQTGSGAKFSLDIEEEGDDKDSDAKGVNVKV